MDRSSEVKRRTFLGWLIVLALIFLLIITYSVLSQGVPTRTITRTLEWSNPVGFDAEFWHYQVEHTTDGINWTSHPSSVGIDPSGITSTAVSFDIVENQAVDIQSRVRLEHNDGYLWGPWATSNVLGAGLHTEATIDGVRTTEITVTIQP